MWCRAANFPLGQQSLSYLDDCSCRGSSSWQNRILGVCLGFTWQSVCLQLGKKWLRPNLALFFSLFFSFFLPPPDLLYCATAFPRPWPLFSDAVCSEGNLSSRFFFYCPLPVPSWGSQVSHISPHLFQIFTLFLVFVIRTCFCHCVTAKIHVTWTQCRHRFSFYLLHRFNCSFSLLWMCSVRAVWWHTHTKDKGGRKWNEWKLISLAHRFTWGGQIILFSEIIYVK